MIEEIDGDGDSGGGGGGNKSVSCTNIPEAFLDRTTALKYFSQFGQIHSFILKPKSFACTVIYESHEEARNALAGGCIYDGLVFSMIATPKEKLKSRSEMNIIDPDVQAELDAMANRTVGPLIRTVIGDSEPVFKKPDVKMLLPYDNVKKPVTSRLTKILDQLQPPAQQMPPVPKILPLMDIVTKNELETVMRKPAFTAEQKYLVLDARDKLNRMTRTTPKDIKVAVSMKGICPDMCPEKERLMREAKHQVALLELEENSKTTMNHKNAIKQYSRSSADQEAPLPHELRPEPILKMTMNYLLHKIVDLCDSSDVNMSDWFHFVWDRTRSIRKEITQQELCSQAVVSLVEQCARWHIHCAARLVAEEPQVFDQKINTENLTKCLQTLKYMYHDLHLKNETCANEAEFRAYVVLLNLHDSNFLWEINHLPNDVRHSTELRFALDVYLAMESNNYVKFFTLVRRTTYMNACILLRYFVQVRVKALNVILKAYVSRGPVAMSLSYWTYILAFEDDEQCAQFFEYHGMQCDRSEDRVVLEKNSLFYPDLPIFMDRAISVVEHKRMYSIGEAVHGSPLESLDEFDAHVPHDSFDENGYLNEAAWTADDQNYYRPKYASPGKEKNVFKVPSVPVTQTKTHQSPKPSIFTKLISKSVTQTKNSPENNTNLTENNPKIFSNVWEKFPKPFAVPTMPSSKHGFSFTSFNQTVASNSTPMDQSTLIVDHKAIDSSSKKIFSVPMDAKVGSDNIFKLPSLGMKSESSKSASSQPQQNLFQLPKSQPPQSSNLFSKPNVFSQNIFNSKQVNEKPLKPLDTIDSKAIVKPAEIVQAVMTTGTKKTSELFALTPFNQSKAKDLAPPISDILPLFPPKSKAIEGVTVKEVEEKPIQEELAQKLAEKEKLKNAKEMQKKAELKQEKLKLIHSTSQLMCNEILERCLSDDIERLAENELKNWEQFNENCQQKLLELLTESMNEILVKIATKSLVEIQEAKRQKNIENMPIWMPDISFQEQIQALQHPNQNDNLNLMRRYRNGMANSIQLPSNVEEKIDIFQIIPPEIPCKLRSKKLHKSTIYWKCAISIPDTAEDPHFQRVDKWLNNIFRRQTNRQSTTDGVFFCEEFFHPLAQCGFGICLRKLIGSKLLNENGKNCPNDASNSNAVLFFVSTQNLVAAEQRLQAILQNPGANDAIGIFVYNSAGKLNKEQIRTELNLNRLCHGKNDLDLFCCSNSNQQTLGNLLENSLKFLASQYSFESLLEMQSTTAFVAETLANQFWDRINVSARRNPGLSKSMTNIHFVICLYNDAVERMIGMCSKDFSHHPCFPDELRCFVPNITLDTPLDYEHFPSDWKSPKRTAHLVKFLTQLRLNSIQLDVSSIDAIQKSLLDYCSHQISAEPQSNLIAYRMIEVVLKHLNGMDSMEISIQQLSWLEPFRLLTVELLYHRYNESKSWLPMEIIYNKEDLREYRLNPWWLHKNGLLKNVRVAVTDESMSDDSAATKTIKKRRICHIDRDELDAILAKSVASMHRADVQIEKYKTISETAKAVTHNLDELLYVHEQANTLLKMDIQRSLRK